MNTVYTIGYNADWTVAGLHETVESLDALLFDIRYNPWSPKVEWQKDNLQTAFGERYRHVRALGNANYRKGGGIAIADLPLGLRDVAAAGKPVVLLCACSSPANCHRTIIADRLRIRGHPVSELRAAPDTDSIALSIRQPWAWLIVSGYKDIENRSWATTYRGRFYVHAPGKFDTEGYQWLRYHHPDIPLPARASFRRGGIVGSAELTDVVTVNDSPWFVGPVGFVLGNPRARPFTPCGGQRGFFRVYNV